MAEKQIAIVVSEGKLYIGNIDIEEATTSAISMEDALEIREMLLPNEQNQIQRMVNYTTVSPFDKNTHSLLITRFSAVVKLDPQSDTVGSYKQFKQQFSLIQPAMPGVDFGGKFGPIK